ncbi:MAG: Xylose isomerase domain protein barrel [Herbinix sp.]|nr:Xylose isomerase domain protein barrel [Herbinix sp.]
MDYGVQIFGCMSQCKEDPEGFFRTLSEAGYRQIEPCVLFDDPIKVMEKARNEGNAFMLQLLKIIWMPKEVSEYLRIMKKYGLTLSSVHVFAEQIHEAVELMIETAKINQISSYVVNCNQQTIATDYLDFARECAVLSKNLKEHGIELWIHNNGAEMKARAEYNGRQVPVLTAILEECSENDVGLQIDVGWVLYGGVDPVEYLLACKDFVRSVHFKDLKKDFREQLDGDIFACLGDGALNVKEILGCVPNLNSGITVLVDQDASDGDIMEDMKKSHQVLIEAMNG